MTAMRGSNTADPVNKIRNLGSEKIRYTEVLKANGTNTSNATLSQNATERTRVCGAEIGLRLAVSFISLAGPGVTFDQHFHTSSELTRHAIAVHGYEKAKECEPDADSRISEIARGVALGN